MTETKELNGKLSTVLNFLQSYLNKHGYPPCVREIGAELNMKSTATVHYYLKKLEDIGAIKRNSSKNRSIEIMPEYCMTEKDPNVIEVPLVGKIAAGIPITAVEYCEEVFNLPRNLFNYSEGLFMLKVSGESMIEAGILDGDRVIIRQQNTADNGSIVAALIDDEATLKRFYREDGHIRLKPENRTMSDIIVKDAQILGIAVGLIRPKLF